MSEAEQEQVEQPEPEAPEPEIPLEEPEPEPAPEEPAEPEEDINPSLDAQREAQDEAWNALGKKATNYAKGVVAILEDTPLPVTVCEMCADALAGFRFIEPQDELRAQLVMVVQGPGGSAPLEEDPNARICEDCKGWGAVKTGSHVPNNETRHCRRCNGAGFVELHPTTRETQAPVAAPVNGGAEPLVGVPLDDPDIQKVRDRGYMVVPLPTIGAPEE